MFWYNNMQNNNLLKNDQKNIDQINSKNIKMQEEISILNKENEIKNKKNIEKYKNFEINIDSNLYTIEFNKI